MILRLYSVMYAKYVTPGLQGAVHINTEKESKIY